MQAFGPDISIKMPVKRSFAGISTGRYSYYLWLGLLHVIRCWWWAFTHIFTLICPCQGLLRTWLGLICLGCGLLARTHGLIVHDYQSYAGNLCESAGISPGNKPFCGLSAHYIQAFSLRAGIFKGITSNNSFSFSRGFGPLTKNYSPNHRHICTKIRLTSSKQWPIRPYNSKIQVKLAHSRHNTSKISFTTKNSLSTNRAAYFLL